MATIKLTNPDQKPSNIILTATQVGAVNQFFLDDSWALSSALGLVGGVTALEFDVVGPVTADNVKKYLQSYALIVCGYNFQSSVANELSNNLSQIHPNLDGDAQKDTIFSGAQQSAMAQNQNLLNVNSPFIWTGGTALRIPVTAGTGAVYTLTMKIVDAVPYGRLDQYLNENPQYRASGC